MPRDARDVMNLVFEQTENGCVPWQQDGEGYSALVGESHFRMWQDVDGEWNITVRNEESGTWNLITELGTPQYVENLREIIFHQLYTRTMDKAYADLQKEATE